MSQTWRRCLALLLLLACFAAPAPAAHTLALPGRPTPLPVIRRADSPDDRVALSFDLTWGEAEYRRIRSILTEKGVPATFFAGGNWVANHPQELQRLAADGHEVGTLGLRIARLEHVPPGQLTAQLMHAQNMLERVLGRPVRLFRPPLDGQPGPAVLAAAEAAGLLTVTYSLDSHDQSLRGSKLVRQVVRRARRGDIVRLTASDFAPATAEALPQIIDGLTARGFRLVTIGDLLPEPR